MLKVLSVWFITLSTLFNDEERAENEMSKMLYKLISGAVVAGTALTGVIFIRMKNHSFGDNQDRNQDSFSRNVSENMSGTEALSAFKRLFKKKLVQAFDLNENSTRKPYTATRTNTASAPSASCENSEKKDLNAAIKKDFLAIRTQNAEVLRTAGLPTIEELYELHTKAQIAETRYDASVKAKSLLFGRGNVCDCLHRIRSYKVSVPDNVTVIHPDDSEMALQRLVWNTDLSLVFSFNNNLEKLTFAPNESNFESMKDYSDRLLEVFSKETELNDAKKLIDSYKSKKVSLEEKIERYASPETEAQIGKILLLADHLKHLLKSDACQTLAQAEITPDDAVVLCDTLQVEMSKCVLAYYQKIIAFVENEADAFLKEAEANEFWTPAEDI